MSAVPLVLAFAEAGYRVNVHDTNRQVLETLQSGRLPFIEYGGEELLARALKQDRLVFTSSPAEISRPGPVIVTIGTPIDEFLNPVRKVVQDCIDALLPHLADGQLLVLRSTVFPGTTEWLDAHLKRNNRALKVAFCPERMVQGHGIAELKETPQIISGTTPAAEAEAGEAVFRHRPRARGGDAARSRIGQAVQQCLPLHRVRDREPVLPDREGGRPRLPAGLRRDEAQLSARARHSHARAARPARA